jgi:hypothetical protein
MDKAVGAIFRGHRELDAAVYALSGYVDVYAGKKP